MKNGTKRSLIMSLLSMVLCMSMLIGTTFAWFTDEATSTGNKIQAGKLDVELLMHNGTEYKDISAQKEPIFGEGSIAQNNNSQTLWEPGKTQVAYLAIKNAGNLDLKYKVNLDVTNPTDSKDLYKVMKYAIIADADPVNNKVTSWNVAEGNEVVVGTQAASEEVSLEVGATHYFALAIHMDESAGNEYQEGKVEFDVTVFATQLNSEEDSFGTDYDKITVVSDADELEAAIQNGGNIMLANDISITDKTINVPAGVDVTLDLNGKKIDGILNGTGNQDLFLVKGNMTVFNGSVSLNATQNQGWGAMATIFDVTDGGVLNIKNTTLENKGGTDMGFVVHLNNWGEVTLNVENSTLVSNYVAVRVFNTGYDMNNVTIKNSTLQGASAAFWVHNYTEADFSSNEKAESQKALLNFDISDGSNTFNGNAEKDGPIRLGMTNSIFVDAKGLQSELSN